MQRELNDTGIHVFPLGLGGMPLSIAGRPPAEQAFAVIQSFLEGGGDFIDTANVYCLDDDDIGHNERLIADALDRLGARDRVLVATKGGVRRPKGDWTVDGDPAWLRQSCEASLRALRVDCITLYQLHAVDRKVGLQRSLEELIRLRGEGKIRHIGLSNITPVDLELALTMTPIVSVQNRCNPLEQNDFRNGMVDLCAARGVTYIPHSPVGGHHGHVRLPDHPILRRLARRHQASTYQIALAWLLAKGPHILPIPGASKPASIIDSLGAVRVQLDAEEVAAIDEGGV